MILATAGRTADPWQADLLRGDSGRMLLCCSRQSGKSTVASALALKTALLTEGSLVLLLSPTQRQSSELLRDKVRRLYSDLGRPVPVKGEGALSLEFANGSRIISLPGDEGTIRGYSGVALLVIDEASRIPDDLYRAVRPMLAVSGGKLACLSTPFGTRGWFHQEWHGDKDAWTRVKITADQCPRISKEFLAEERRQLGEDWFRQEYECVFTAGGANPLFPEEWLSRAARLADDLQANPRLLRKALAMGVDPGEGQANTVWTVIDELGIMAQLSRKTPDTSDVVEQTITLIRQHGLQADQVLFDRGGGGKQHSDQLRKRGYAVRSVGFGEAVAVDGRLDREKQRDARAYFVNRRAQLFGELREMLDPSANPKGFAIPAEYAELRRQLAPIPLWRDPEGRLFLPPKHRKGGDEGAEKVTLSSLIGCSPDEADSTVLAVHAMLHRSRKLSIGAM